MGEGLWLIDALGIAVRELMLFAAIGVLIIGLDDLLVDLLYVLTLRKRRAQQKAMTERIKASPQNTPLAVFVPAWQEASVIGAMLSATIRAWGVDGYRLYIGSYPNDPATGHAIADAAAKGGPITPVLLDHEGPTTKADCLNALWRAMERDEAALGIRYAGVVIHDAEDMVDPDELRWFGALLADHAMIQLPVVPLVDQRSQWISGHYLDEFAQAHSRDLPVRQALGLSIPGAGVGCCIARDSLAKLGAKRGAPFDPSSLTEDYDLGLAIHTMGGRTAFIAPMDGVPMIRSHFPATLDASVRQKARWIAGIALEGWDRAGWRGGLAERWMRMRDRMAPMAAIILLAAYLALAGLLALLALNWVTGRPVQASAIPRLLIAATSILLLWRLALRCFFTAKIHGIGQGLRAIPRAVTANIIAMMAARRAIGHYLRLSRRGVVRWDKTDHIFPASAAE